jgi:hypothetical protein
MGYAYANARGFVRRETHLPFMRMHFASLAEVNGLFLSDAYVMVIESAFKQYLLKNSRV